jgi:hypothetical protein
MAAAARLNLSYTESQELKELTAYGEIFAMKSDDHGRTDRVNQRIDMREGRPIRQPPSRLLLPKQADVGKRY